MISDIYYDATEISILLGEFIKRCRLFDGVPVSVVAQNLQKVRAFLFEDTDTEIRLTFTGGH